MTGLPGVAQRVLDIPAKRFDRPVLGFLTREEVGAILNAPDHSTWSGRRDAVLLERESAVHLHDKGRKQRVVPPWKSIDMSGGQDLTAAFGALRCQDGTST